MMDLRGLWRRTLSPERGFRELAEAGLPLGPSVARLVILRAPVAFLGSLLSYAGLLRSHRELTSGAGIPWDLLRSLLPPGTSLEDFRFLLESLPAPPPLAAALPWLLLGSPLWVLSLWLHDAVWDHGCLWMLGGLKERRGFRASLVADSEALQAGVFGAALGLLANLPWIGCLLSLPLGIVGAYFWILRGFALAAFHQCPVWKGVVATVLHAALAVLLTLGLLAVLTVLVVQLLA